MMHSLGRSTLLGWQGSFVGRSRRKHGGLLHCSYFRPFKRRDQGLFECSKIPLYVFFLDWFRMHIDEASILW